MSGGKISFVIFLLILGLPVAGLNVLGPDITKWTSAFAERDGTGVPSAEAEAAIVDEPVDSLAWMDAVPGLRDSFSTDEITPERYVAIQEILRTEELLNPGEAQPDSALLALYAAARAPTRLAPYCAEVLEAVGLVCDVIRTETFQNRQGKWEILGQLGFIPAAALGDASAVENGRLLNARAVLPHSGDLLPANEPQTRIELLSQAQAFCNQLRDQFGNCVLSRVDFDVQELWITDLEALPAGTNPQRLETTVHFTVFADQTLLDAAGFSEAVSALVNPS